MKIFFQFFLVSHHLNSTFRCADTVRVRSFLGKLCGVWTTTTTTVVVRTLLWCGNSLIVSRSITTSFWTEIIVYIFTKTRRRQLGVVKKSLPLLSSFPQWCVWVWEVFIFLWTGSHNVSIFYLEVQPSGKNTRIQWPDCSFFFRFAMKFQEKW